MVQVCTVTYLTKYYNILCTLTFKYLFIFIFYWNWKIYYFLHIEKHWSDIKFDRQFLTIFLKNVAYINQIYIQLNITNKIKLIETASDRWMLCVYIVFVRLYFYHRTIISCWVYVIDIICICSHHTSNAH